MPTTYKFNQILRRQRIGRYTVAERVIGTKADKHPLTQFDVYSATGRLVDVALTLPEAADIASGIAIAA